MTPGAADLAVVGAMGSGIAQVAVQAGHVVMLHNQADGAAARGVERIATEMERLVQRGRLSMEQQQEKLSRLHVASAIEELAHAGLVIEAIVEDVQTRRDLFQRVEALVADECIFATNASSLSVTAIAATLRRPERLAGFHFFDPAPVMKLVEMVSGAACSTTAPRPPSVRSRHRRTSTRPFASMAAAIRSAA